MKVRNQNKGKEPTRVKNNRIRRKKRWIPKKAWERVKKYKKMIRQLEGRYE